ncbi:DoxX family protein [Niabella ginsenosidivorans]|uniref:DoxX family protein n=1 Tax=Niabella ginsenosidivorans TaxID=1176587 RepID=A0A1A9I3D5_9BACT|nr:MauE/DoxX family redox-associated membrane protein [Niabella ginsenosidivorans]ANH81230.1 DoxX family protein [Niabella ginsenosidivorans]
MKDLKTIFFFLRLPVAVSLSGHGLVRIPKLAAFSNWMVTTMEKSVLPASLTLTFGYILPFLELLIGLALLIGFKVKYSIFAGLALMTLLILGSCSIENWNAIEAQLIHAAYLSGLLWYQLRYCNEEVKA